MTIVRVEDRAGLNAAVAATGPGDVIELAHLGGLVRSPRALVELAARVRGRGAHLRVLDPAIDSATPEGRAALAVLAAVAEQHSAVISAQTRAGLAAARAQGRRGGRPPALTPARAAAARRLRAEGRYSVGEVAEIVGVGRSTMYRHLAAEQCKPLTSTNDAR